MDSCSARSSVSTTQTNSFKHENSALTALTQFILLAQRIYGSHLASVKLANNAELCTQIMRQMHTSLKQYVDNCRYLCHSRAYSSLQRLFEVQNPEKKKGFHEYERKAMPYRDYKDRVLDWEEVYAHQTKKSIWANLGQSGRTGQGSSLSGDRIDSVVLVSLYVRCHSDPRVLHFILRVLSLALSFFQQRTNQRVSSAFLNRYFFWQLAFMGANRCCSPICGANMGHLMHFSGPSISHHETNVDHGSNEIPTKLDRFQPKTVNRNLWRSIYVFLYTLGFHIEEHSKNPIDLTDVRMFTTHNSLSFGHNKHQEQ